MSPIHFNFDFWTIWGFVGQVIFFLRFIVQWWVTEKKKESIIPDSFWYLSIIGTLILIIYAWKRGDIVFILGFSMTLVVYARNIYFSFKKKKRL